MNKSYFVLIIASIFVLPMIILIIGAQLKCVDGCFEDSALGKLINN